MSGTHRATSAGAGPHAGTQGAAWTLLNLVAIAIAVILFCLLLGSSYQIYVRDRASEQSGVELAEATQNARSGLELMAGELRYAGVGLDPALHPSIVVGSQYRVTFAVDANRNHRVDLGEVITYFLDPISSELEVQTTPHRTRYVLRREAGTLDDPLAVPVLGHGEIVAYGLSQRSSDGVASKDVPLFSFRDSLGSALELGAGAMTDPLGVFFGRSVRGADLGLPPHAGSASQVRSILINLVTETRDRVPQTGGYDRVTVATAVVQGTVSPGAATR